MKMKRWLALVLVAGMMLAMAACTPDAGVSAETSSNPGTSESAGTETSAASEEPVTITYFNTSAEVNTMFEAMFARYHELHPNVTVELIPTAVGEGQQEKLQSLYASGNAPTMMNVDPANVIEYQDNLLELNMEEQSWLSLANAGVIDAGTFDGKIMGVPFSVQGYGLLYNKRVVNEIYGGSFDPATINTQDALKAFFEKIEAAGVPATMIHGANWSVGGHFLTLAYAAQGPATSDGTGYLDQLKAGTAKIADNTIFQGYMDTFDLLKQYNYNSADPLVGDYNADVQAFAEGKCATFFMGDWAWTSMTALENIDTDYGFIPVPWSNDPAAYGNSQVVMVLPKFNVIDKSQSSVEEQQAALALLQWMLTDPEGQQFFLDAGFCMPFSNVRTDVEYNTMTASIAEYAAAGKTINLGCFSYITGDAWTQTGNLMLQYLAGAIDRQGLADGIDAYWQSVG
jgi:raffinose/stachyose/melibiose transport system substrate-binding protein